MPRLRMGILGAGGIAGHFAAASAEFQSIDILAIGSREKSKAEAFAGKYEISKSYGAYQAVIDDKEIEAVYIALPNGLHKEWAIKCAQAGKHILAKSLLPSHNKTLEKCSSKRTRTK